MKKNKDQVLVELSESQIEEIAIAYVNERRNVSLRHKPFNEVHVRIFQGWLDGFYMGMRCHKLGIKKSESIFLNNKSIKMKHERFKVFKVLHNDMSEVIAFLKDAPITPKSLSISHIEGTEDAILSIGYENEESKHDFQLVTYKVVNGVNEDTKHVEEKLNGFAEQTNGVICQDIVVFNSDIIVTFLTTK